MKVISIKHLIAQNTPFYGGRVVETNEMHGAVSSIRLSTCVSCIVKDELISELFFFFFSEFFSFLSDI